MQVESILKKLSIFSEMDRVDLAKLVPELEEVSFEAGEILFHKGDYGDSLIIILSGKARVFISTEDGQETNLAILGEHECLGEMALLTGTPRSASVQAETDIHALRLSREHFETLIQKHRFLAVHLTRLLSHRLAATNEESVNSRENPSESVPHHPFGQNLVAHEISAETDPSIYKEAKWYSSIWGKIAITVSALTFCLVIGLLLKSTGFERNHILLLELLLLASLGWGFNVLSFNAISLALPVAVVLFGVADTQNAFSGFSSSSWFLVLGVLAIGAAMTNTGLLYRMALSIIARFSPGYLGQTLSLAITGLILTPIIPSVDGRISMANSFVMDFLEVQGIKSGSSGAVGMAMACMLGFGQMSFMFMNGNTSCLLVLGLLPLGMDSSVSWAHWFLAALPLGVCYLALSWLAIILLFRPQGTIALKKNVVQSQLRVLGRPTRHEKISLLAVGLFFIGVLTQSWHHINTAWVAMVAFLILFGYSVLDEDLVRRTVDWNKLISFGALIGFGAVMQKSGFTTALASKAAPFLMVAANHKMLFLMIIALLVYLLRFALPLIPTLMITALTIMPVGSLMGINPLLIGLVLLVASNPWFLPYQSSTYQSLSASNEGDTIHDRRMTQLTYIQIGIILFSIGICMSYWNVMGLLN
ncbi:MAG: SLC13 family permease [Chitinophagales bacterium]